MFSFLYKVLIIQTDSQVYFALFVFSSVSSLNWRNWPLSMNSATSPHFIISTPNPTPAEGKIPSMSQNPNVFISPFFFSPVLILRKRESSLTKRMSHEKVLNSDGWTFVWFGTDVTFYKYFNNRQIYQYKVITTKCY